MQDPGFRFAFVSHALPPSASGQTVVTGRLLRGLTPRLIELDGEFQLRRGSRFGVQLVNAALGIWSRARRITRILREERYDVVVAATGDDYDLPAAYLASRRAGVPFVAYYFDDYIHQSWHPRMRWLARRIEPRMLRGAARVIVPNEAMRDELRARCGVDAAVVRNAVDVGAYERNAGVPPADRAASRRLGERDAPRSAAGTAAFPKTVVYTGAVAESHYDAFRNLLAAIDGTPYELHVYTAQPPDRLPGGVFHPYGGDMPRVQSEADILFLPLALESRYPSLIRTSAPAKLGEYLASGRPILAHVPADSFVARFLREHDCGTVVSDPKELRAALQRVTCDPQRARAVAQREFGIDAVRERFLDVLREAAAR